MSLADVWFGLFVLIIAGYLILDGFDIGVGIVHMLVARSDRERRVILNSIGPIWDGNEVWIVLGGGVLFAAFPFVYASLFSGLYLAFMLVLLVLILRTTAIEFRSKRTSERWRSAWDSVFAVSSIGLGLLLGVAFGNILEGFDLDDDGNIHEGLIDLISPYSVLVGLTALSMFGLHGLLFLSMKTQGELEQRVRHLMPFVMALFFVLTTASVVATAGFQDQVSERFLDDIWPVIFPAAALGAFLFAWKMSGSRRDFEAFAAFAVSIAMLLISGAVGMYPNLLLSTENDQFNLTVDNAASASSTLTVMLVFALIGIPLVLLYTSGVYYFFRGKTELGPDSY
jgi:cytochrome bd ubiquinol oxidase subunit II